MRLWIDTDVGDNPDDAVALLCAAAHPEVQVVGVSTTGGRTEWRAALARVLVDTVVVPGEDVDTFAVGFRDAEPDALLAIGPLTNVAVLVALGLARLPITVMGGVIEPVRHRGRVQQVEHNFGCDPAAAALVVERTDAAIVPLDVTVAMRLDRRQLDRLTRADARVALEVARWHTAHDDPVVLHDPLALLAAVGEPMVRTAGRRLTVDAACGAIRLSDDGVEHPVAVDSDTPVAVDRVLGLMGASAPG